MRRFKNLRIKRERKSERYREERYRWFSEKDIEEGGGEGVGKKK